MSDDPKDRARHELGRRIKQAREAKGLSQAKLGAHAFPLPVTAQSVLKWEKGLSAPNARTLDAIAQLTGKPVKWFLYGVEDAGAAGQGDEEPQVGRVIPMVTFANINSYLSGDKRATSGSVRTNFPCSANSFQTYVQDDANHPEIQVGDSIVIDMDRRPRPGKLCMALQSGEPVIGRYRPRGAHVVIAPVNEEWPAVEVTAEDIVGAITEIARPHG